MRRLGQSPCPDGPWQELLGHDLSDWDFWKRRGYTDYDLDCALQFTPGPIEWTDETGEHRRNLIALPPEGYSGPLQPDAAEQLNYILSHAIAAAGEAVSGVVSAARGFTSAGIGTSLAGIPLSYWLYGAGAVLLLALLIPKKKKR